MTRTRPVEIIETAHADGTHAIVIGRHRQCRVIPNVAGFVRITENGSIHGRRYHFRAKYDDAIADAIAWANRPQNRNGASR